MVKVNNVLFLYVSLLLYPNSFIGYLRGCSSWIPAESMPARIGTRPNGIAGRAGGNDSFGVIVNMQKSNQTPSG
ncbi:MAG: hypothetical protein ACYST3_03395 [Planctomycetota bacterium]|jgi:hypothetical protein